MQVALKNQQQPKVFQSVSITKDPKVLLLTFQVTREFEKLPIKLTRLTEPKHMAFLVELEGHPRATARLELTFELNEEPYLRGRVSTYYAPETDNLFHLTIVSDLIRSALSEVRFL